MTSRTNLQNQQYNVQKHSNTNLLHSNTEAIKAQNENIIIIIITNLLMHQ